MFYVKMYGTTVYTSDSKEKATKDYVARLGRGPLELWHITGDGRVCTKLMGSQK